MIHRTGRRAAAIGVSPVVGLALLLAGCTGSSSGDVTAAPGAGTSACATAIAAAPATVLGHPRSPLPVPGTAAWGEPAIVLRCGVPEQAPTTKRCLTVNDVDWIVDDSGDPIVFTAYGRSPTAQVRVPRSYGAQNAPSVLVALDPAAAALPKTAHACIG